MSMCANETKPRPGRSTIHVYPLRGGHVLDGMSCWCMPKFERGAYADLVIHNQYAAGVKAPRREC